MIGYGKPHRESRFLTKPTKLTLAEYSESNVEFHLTMPQGAKSFQRKPTQKLSNNRLYKVFDNLFCLYTDFDNFFIIEIFLGNGPRYGVKTYFAREENDIQVSCRAYSVINQFSIPKHNSNKGCLILKKNKILFL